jgi:hypothetical protein
MTDREFDSVRIPSFLECHMSQTIPRIPSSFGPWPSGRITKFRNSKIIMRVLSLAMQVIKDRG